MKIEHQHHIDGVDENWQCDRILFRERTLKLWRFCDTMRFNINFFRFCCSLSDIATAAIIYIVRWRKNKGRIMKRIELLMYLNGFFCCHRRLSHSSMQLIVGVEPSLHDLNSPVFFSFFNQPSVRYIGRGRGRGEFVELLRQRSVCATYLTYNPMHLQLSTWPTTHPAEWTVDVVIYARFIQ